MKVSLATVMNSFLADCHANKEVGRARVKKICCNLLCAREIPIADRVTIALGLLKEWKPDSADEILAEFCEEFKHEWKPDSPNEILAELREENK